jgi:hypothetical protein
MHIVVKIILILVIGYILDKTVVRAWVDYANVIIRKPISVKSSLNYTGEKEFKLSAKEKGISWSMSFWMYIKDWQYREGHKKTLMTTDGFTIYLDNITNDLIVEIKYYKTPCPPNKCGGCPEHKNPESISTLKPKIEIEEDLLKTLNVDLIELENALARLKLDLKSATSNTPLVDQFYGGSNTFIENFADAAPSPAATIQGKIHEKNTAIASKKLAITESTAKIYTLKGELNRKTFNVVGIDKIIYTRIPLQRWINIVIIVDNRTVDLWVNNKLFKSLYLPNIPIISSISAATIPCGDGFDGFISGLTVWDHVINKNMIYYMTNNSPVHPSLYDSIIGAFYRYIDDTIDYIHKNVVDIDVTWIKPTKIVEYDEGNTCNV